MLVDGISRSQLHSLAVDALIGAKTMAADRVYEFADWPTRPELFPLLLVSVQGDRKVALFPGTLQFTTTMSLIIVGRVFANLPQPAGLVLEQLSGQILEAILLHPILQRSVQEFRVIETDSSVRADGKQHVGEVSMKFDVVVYQEYGPTGDPLTSIDATAVALGGSGTIAPEFEIQLLPGPDTIS